VLVETSSSSAIRARVSPFRYISTHSASGARRWLLLVTDAILPPRAALAGLDDAIDATAWMETLATVDGEYPILRE
jgi:hypothetical protein